MSDTPLVSYLVPCYCHEQYVAQTIESILAQDYSNIEIIACDDNSPDKTFEVLMKYQSQKVKVLRNNPNIGAVKTLNNLFQMAHGTYVGFIGSDDWMEPSKTRNQVQYLVRTGKQCVLGPIKKFFQDTKETQIAEIAHLQSIFDNNQYLQHLYGTDSEGALMQSGLFDSDCVKKIGCFLENYKSDDWLFMIRWMQAGYSVGFLNEAHVNYRIHPTNAYSNVEKCLYELEMPVIRDFIPKDLQPAITSTVYFNAALKSLVQSRTKALRYLLASQKNKAHAGRAVHFAKCWLLSFGWIAGLNKSVRHRQ